MPSISARTIGINGAGDTPTDDRPGAPAQSLSAPVGGQTTITRSLLPAGTMVPGQSQAIFSANSGAVPTQTVWPVVPVSPVVQKTQLNATPQQPVPQPPVQKGQPYQVVSISAASEPYKTTDGTVKCAVSVSFVPYPYDPNYTNTRIWFEGYHGSQTPQLMAEGPTSPVSFLADPTGENVTVYAEAISNQGVTSKGPVTAYAPKDTIDLASTVGIPPTPSLAQTLRGTPTGYQFAFNQLAGLAANVIDGYAIYRNTTDTDTGATQINYLKHNPANATPVVVSDVAGQGETYFYWVSAYDTSGNESNLLAAQDGTIAPLSTFTPAGQIWGPATITGTSAAQMTMQEMHDSVGLTLQSNLLQNANFAAGNVGWSVGAGWSIVATGGVIPVPPSGSAFVAIHQATGNGYLKNSQKISCSAGNVLSASCQAFGNVGVSGQARTVINFYEADGTFISSPTAPNVIADGKTWMQSRLTATAPQNASYAMVSFNIDNSTTTTAWLVSAFTASLLANSVDEVPNGTNYVRTSTQNVDPNTGAVTGFQGQGALATVNQADTVNIVAGAVNSSILFNSTVLVECPANSTITVAQSTIATNGGYVKVRFVGYLFNQSNGSTYPKVNLYKGDSSGTLLQSLGNFFVVPGSVQALAAMPVILEWIDASPAASQIYTVTCVTDAASLQFNPTTLTVENAKV